jgi:hypothetical protein
MFMSIHLSRMYGCQVRSARIFAHARPVDDKLPRMPTSFAKLLEPKISHFAKIKRMTTSFGKLSKMLCVYSKLPGADGPYIFFSQ